jgi:hypothetical protein
MFLCVLYPLCHFLGLWAIGTVIGTTLDVDLLTLRRRGIIRILVGMVNTVPLTPFLSLLMLWKNRCVHPAL